MMFAIFFAFWRGCQIITMIPCMGMLAWFVDNYVKANALSPDWLLVIFITSVLALIWAIFTIFSYHRSSSNALFVGFIDLCFVGAFIASIWYLRWISKQSCTSVDSSGSSWTGQFGSLGSITLNGWDVNTDKPCAMLKACWAFAIMNVFFFFFSAVLAMLHGNKNDDKYYHKERHSHRSHRSGSHRRDSHRSGSRRGSRHSSHSRHSHRRVFV